jgi:predicted MFS family arabinose efflux permease
LLLVATSLLSWVFADSLPLLALFKLVGSLAQVFASTLMLSLLFDLIPAEQRAGSLALFSVAGMLTNPVSSLSGEAILRLVGGRGLFLLGAGFALASWLWFLLFKESPTRSETGAPPSFKEVAARRELRPLFVLAFTFGIYYSALTSFLPHHTKLTLGEANLSAFLIPFSAVSVVMRLVLGRQLDQRPPRRFLYWSFLSIFLSLDLLLLPDTWTWVILAGFFYGIGHSILYPLMNAMFVEAGGAGRNATYSNAYLVANQLGAVLMTPLLGTVGDLGGFFSIIVVLALTALGCFLLARKYFPRPPRQPEADPPSVRSS